MLLPVSLHEIVSNIMPLKFSTVCYELLYLQIFFETTTQQKSVSAQL